METNYWSSVWPQRLSHRRALAATGATAAGAALLAACGGKETGPAGTASGLVSKPLDETKTAVRGGALVVAGRRLTSLDPMGSSAVGIASKLYSTLWQQKGGYQEPFK